MYLTNYARQLPEDDPLERTYVNTSKIWRVTATPCIFGSSGTPFLRAHSNDLQHCCVTPAGALFHTKYGARFYRESKHGEIWMDYPTDATTDPWNFQKKRGRPRTPEDFMWSVCAYFGPGPHSMILRKWDRSDWTTYIKYEVTGGTARLMWEELRGMGLLSNAGPGRCDWHFSMEPSSIEKN